MKAGFFILIALALCPPFLSAQTGSPGQDRPDALRSYHIGRDLENRSGLAAADPYYREAVRICGEEIAQNRATRDSYTILTWALRRQEKFSDVILWGERGLRLYGDDYRIVEIMGEAYFYLDDYGNSLRFMQRYVNALPQGDRASVAYFFIGEIYRLQRKFRRADIAYSTAVRLEPGLPLWWYRLGTVRESAGDLAPAAEAFERALRLNPNYREAADALGRLRGRRG